MDTNTAATVTTTTTVSVDALAIRLSPARGEADHAAAHAYLIGRRAVFTTYEGEEVIGTLEAPQTGPASTGGYLVIRFADGKWARADDTIVLVVDLPTVGDLVEFRADTPQYRANKGITYRVTPTPSGGPFSVDETGRVYVWLEDDADAHKAPSRRGTRSGYADALTIVTED